MKAKFYKCPHCGNVVMMLVDSGVTPVCCGEKMTLLEPKSTDVYKEKHVPVIESKGDGKILVKVGEVPHPMTPEHRICFIAVETEHGIEIKFLDQAKPAEAEFKCCCKVVTVYEYCNMHGLWICTKCGECCEDKNAGKDVAGNSCNSKCPK